MDFKIWGEFGCCGGGKGKAADPLRSSAALQKLAHHASFWSATAKLSLFGSMESTNYLRLRSRPEHELDQS